MKPRSQATVLIKLRNGESYTTTIFGDPGLNTHQLVFEYLLFNRWLEIENNIFIASSEVVYFSIIDEVK